MAYELVRIKRTVFTVLQICIDMFEAKSFLTIREKFNNKFNRCFKCNCAFFKEQTEKISLAICTGGNKVLCKTCAEYIAQLNDPDIEIIRKLK